MQTLGIRAAFLLRGTDAPDPGCLPSIPSELGPLDFAAPMNIPHYQFADFCAKWRITEFAFFGSVLRDDFGPDSDVDVLVSFAPDAP